MRKHVTPTRPDAAIPDPERGGDLPPEGREVAWTAYWARHELQGNITVAEAASDPLDHDRDGRKGGSLPGSRAKS